MDDRISAILKIEVPIIVEIGHRDLPCGEVINLVPGAIIELPKQSDEELDLLVNNRAIGVGVAVKVGEHFGIQIAKLGGVEERIDALGSHTLEAAAAEPGIDAEALADQFLSGQ